MTLRVQYVNGKYDYVDNRTLDELIEQDLIRQFYRPSEKRWVDIETDPVRGKVRFYSLEEQRWVSISVTSLKGAGKAYTGPERRRCNIAA
jgi:hypothetical protein